MSGSGGYDPLQDDVIRRDPVVVGLRLSVEEEELLGVAAAVLQMSVSQLVSLWVKSGLGLRS